MLTLYHINASPFAEKARWALDYKRLDWTSELLMPGRHADVVEGISGTRTVPVLVDSEAADPITDSTDILQYVEQLAPQPSLFPDDAEQRQRVLDIEEWLDEEVTRPIARFNYCYISEHPQAFLGYFMNGLSKTQKMGAAMIRPMLPGLVAQFREDRELSREAAATYRREAFAACDRIEQLLDEAAEGFLVGNAFSAADLTAACVLGLGLRIAGTPWEPGKAELKAYPGGTEPQEMLDYRDELGARLAARWVAELWQNHRSPTRIPEDPR